MWWHTPIILASGTWGQKDQELATQTYANLGYMGCYLKKNWKVENKIKQILAEIKNY